jgi:hypothetical protein
MGQKNKKIKNGSPSAVFVALGEEVLPRVPGTRYSGKGSLPRVLQIRHSGKHFLLLFFYTIFLWGLQTLFKTPCPNLAYFWIFYYISLVFSFSWIFRHTSNLNCRYIKSYNLAIQKIIFIVLGVYWVLIHQLTWNIEHLVVVTWLTTYGESVSKLQKIRTKFENQEICRGVVLSHV